MKFTKGTMDDHEDNFAIVFAAMGVSTLKLKNYIWKPGKLASYLSFFCQWKTEEYVTF